MIAFLLLMLRSDGPWRAAGMNEIFWHGCVIRSNLFSLLQLFFPRRSIIMLTDIYAFVAIQYCQLRNGRCLMSKSVWSNEFLPCRDNALKLKNSSINFRRFARVDVKTRSPPETGSLLNLAVAVSKISNWNEKLSSVSKRNVKRSDLELFMKNMCRHFGSCQGGEKSGLQLSSHLSIFEHWRFYLSSFNVYLYFMRKVELA